MPGKLAFDSLTVDSLRLKLSDTEHRLTETTNELKLKQNLLTQHETEIVSIQNSHDGKNASRLVGAWTYI